MGSRRRHWGMLFRGSFHLSLPLTLRASEAGEEEANAGGDHCELRGHVDGRVSMVCSQSRLSGCSGAAPSAPFWERMRSGRRKAGGPGIWVETEESGEGSGLEEEALVLRLRLRGRVVRGPRRCC